VPGTAATGRARAGRLPAVLGTDGRRSSLVKPLSPPSRCSQNGEKRHPSFEVPRSFEGRSLDRGIRLSRFYEGVTR
jgi:hypothetical protein